MVYFQQSLFGKMSWERFHQMTGWILEPSYPLSQTPMFQCLLLEDGQEPEWCEGIRPISHGGSWMPSIGQAPDWHDGSASLLWQTLEDNVPTKYFLSPAQCSQFLRLAEIAGCPPPAEIEALLLKQGGVYRSPDPFNAMAAPTRNEAERRLDFWLEACDHLNLPEFKSCRKMLANWRRYILMHSTFTCPTVLLRAATTPSNPSNASPLASEASAPSGLGFFSLQGHTPTFDKEPLFRDFGLRTGDFWLYGIKYPSENCVFGRTVVGLAGLEPARTNVHQILSLRCLPFHHSPG